MRIEWYDTVVIVVTIVTLIAVTYLLQRTMFGLALRAAAADFDTARLMGVQSNRVIRGAFALSGFLAGIAGIFWLMREGQTTPSAGIDPMLSGVLAALIGGLGSLRGAVIGGFALGLAEVLLRSWLPSNIQGLTSGVVFLLIALLFIFRPRRHRVGAPRRAGVTMGLLPDLRRDVVFPLIGTVVLFAAMVGDGPALPGGVRWCSRTAGDDRRSSTPSS